MTAKTFPALSAHGWLDPLGPFRCVGEHWALILRLTKREIEAKYRGSFLGIAWAVIVPLLLLTVYTFVFSVVFVTRWNRPIGGKGEFALVLFAGLIVFNFFSETVTRAPSLMLAHTSYIKKVVFPIEILPMVVLLSSAVNALLSAIVLLCGYVLLIGVPPVSALMAPIAIFPLVLFTLGLAEFLASIGVYIRDLQQVIGIVVLLLMFLSPIFYPMAALPQEYQRLVYLNPLAVIIEWFRGTLFWGQVPGLLEMVGSLVVSLLIAWLGFSWFMKTKKGFADVI